jgi:hypothetical protein
MRNGIFLALTVSLILAGSGSGFCQDSEGPLGDPLPPAVQDPSLSSSRYFPASLTTAGVADTGPALGSVNKGRAGGHGIGCSVTNPCAVLSPALDHAIPAHAG